MNLTVSYNKRDYGLGSPVRDYQITIWEREGYYYKPHPNPSKSKAYSTRELQIKFQCAKPVQGRSWDEFSDAVVRGGVLELSDDAARKLANAILEYLDAPPEAPVKMVIEEEPTRV